MSERTKGPIEVANTNEQNPGICYIRPVNRSYPSEELAVCYPAGDNERSHADARRLVACWNAFLEVTDPENCDVVKMIAKNVALESERDELVWVLREVRAMISGSGATWGKTAALARIDSLLEQHSPKVPA